MADLLPAAQLVVRNATGQSLRCLAQEIGGSAAQNEEATSRVGLIYENAQAGKELRPPVYLVHHDEAFQGPESQQRVREM